MLSNFPSGHDALRSVSAPRPRRAMFLTQLTYRDASGVDYRKFSRCGPTTPRLVNDETSTGQVAPIKCHGTL